MSDVGAVWAAMEPFCSDFGQWPTVIIHSEGYIDRVQAVKQNCTRALHVRTERDRMH